MSYKLPSKLSAFQRKVYEHLIDVKWELYPDTKGQPGVFKGHEYDAIFPDDYSHSRVPKGLPFMLFDKCIEKRERLLYKPHKFANHAVSSQTACVNLFLPLLESASVNEILLKFPYTPKDFKEIDRNALHNGYCFEFWDEENGRAKGHLEDHSPHAGTDADIAIAYINKSGEHCIWLIEHKLTEAEFTQCGGYNSTLADKKFCNSTNPLSSVQKCDPQGCRYFHIYNYWTYTKSHIGSFSDLALRSQACPFKKGMNQLWRNQLLAFALEDNKRVAHAHFSVVYHHGNGELETKVKEYSGYFNESVGFNYFTSKSIVDTAEQFMDKDKELRMWIETYRHTYLNI